MLPTVVSLTSPCPRWHLPSWPPTTAQPQLQLLYPMAADALQLTSFS